MKEHTEEKIRVYRAYLTNYLFVMCHAPYDLICIWEPFAGVGWEKDGSKGSAIAAAEIINGFRDKYKKDIRLFLNELDSERYEQLQNSLAEYEEFTEIYNDDAKDFLGAVTTTLKHQQDIHSLFFIDPYGYTQYSQENLNTLLQLKNCDYLLFIPTNHIYRFRRKEESSAKKFLLQLGINEERLTNEHNKHELARDCLNALKQKAKTDFGYYYELENRKNKAYYYHLFFITKNKRGAEKFLEAKNAITKEIEQYNLQLFDPATNEKEDFLQKTLSKQIDNKSLYIAMLKKGYLSQDIMPILKEWEKHKKITIECNENRRKSAFYLKLKPEKTVYIQSNENNTH